MHARVYPSRCMCPVGMRMCVACAGMPCVHGVCTRRGNGLRVCACVLPPMCVCVVYARMCVRVRVYVPSVRVPHLVSAVFFLFRTLTRRNVYTGNKTFLLFSPEDCPNLYVYPSLHPGYRQSQILDARHVSLLDFPAFAMTSVAQVDMGPGDGKLRICYTRLTPL